ncbi:MAG: hypothetical protein GXO15_06025 [Crenarchaeota archaeon]|nr:hypothetical protein [Thermoproteota archaeon]
MAPGVATLLGVQGWAATVLEELARCSRCMTAAVLAAGVCRGEGCDPSIAAVAAGLYTAGRGAGQGLPRHARHHVEAALAEAEEAYLRSPTSVYAQVVLDADALSRMGILGLYSLALHASRLERLLQVFMEAMSYAAASDYILYTRTARRLAQQLYKPHTMAAAKWVAEELQKLGFTVEPRVETGSAGLVAYLDLQRCPCGRAAKEIYVKPEQRCIRYRVSYSCCGTKLESEVCTPESTRVR